MKFNFASRPSSDLFPHSVSVSLLNASARVLLVNDVERDWRKAVDGLLRAHRRTSGSPLNSLAPALPCYLHELLPQAAFGEILRRAFAPDWHAACAVELGISTGGAGNALVVLSVLDEWQRRVVDPFAEVYGL